METSFLYLYIDWKRAEKAYRLKERKRMHNGARGNLEETGPRVKFRENRFE